MLGEEGGAGQFYQRDACVGCGGVRDAFNEKGLEYVLLLRYLGQKTINLKERGF